MVVTVFRRAIHRTIFQLIFNDNCTEFIFRFSRSEFPIESKSECLTKSQIYITNQKKSKLTNLYILLSVFLVSCWTVEWLKTNVIWLTPDTLFIRLKIQWIAKLPFKSKYSRYAGKKHAKIGGWDRAWATTVAVVTMAAIAAYINLRKHGKGGSKRVQITHIVKRSEKKIIHVH